MAQDLTNSGIDRANILNNSYALEKIQEYIGISWILFEDSYRFTKRQVADFYQVDERTLERYLEQNEGELRKNGYEILTGKRLSEAKKLFGPDIDVATKTTILGLFDFRSFLNLGMILVESERARELRRAMLDIVLDTIHEKSGGNTKYINQREEDYLIAAIRDHSCRQEFTEALQKYVAMWNVKYAIYTNRIYESIFRENATEYRAILKLSEKENLRETMYSEVLTTISSFETGLAFELKKEFEKNWNRRLTPKKVSEIFESFSAHPSQRPYLETARMKMASRDIHFRDALHEKLAEYIRAVPKDDFEKFLWERSKTLEERIEDHKDVFVRLKDK